MTVDTTVNRTQTDGDGAKTNFAYGFRIVKAADLSVFYTDELTTVMTTLIEGTDYSVNDVGEDNGTIDLLATGVLFDWTVDPPSADSNILCLRAPDLLQAEVFKRQGNYRATDVEDGLDFAMMCLQMVDERVDRCVRVQASSDADPDDLIIEGLATTAEVDLKTPTLLGSETASASASLDITGAELLDYDVLLLELLDLRPATTDNVLWLRMSDDLGVSWFVNGYRYVGDGRSELDASTGWESSNDAAGHLTVSVDANQRVKNTLACTVWGDLRIFDHVDGRPRWQGEITWGGRLNSDNNRARILGSQASYGINGIQVLFGSGNITSGSIRLWGLPAGA